jgi:cytochrome c peroxidase
LIFRNLAFERGAYCLAFVLILSGLSACSSGDDPTDVDVRPDLREKYGLEPYGYDDIPYPADNGPDDVGYAERVELGRLLFFDHLLAGDLDTSCGTCHHPALAWADGRPLGAGVTGEGLGPDRILDSDDPFITDMPRNVPTNLNAGLSSSRPGGPPDADGIMFWDSRAASLEVQALQPTATFDEMRHYAYSDSAAADSVKMRLRQIPEYVGLFSDAFPAYAEQMSENPEDPDSHVIRVGSIELALSAYQRELITLSSPYDDYLAGDDNALSDAQFRGMDLFFGKANCGSCHYGPMLSNYQMVRAGVAHSGPGRVPVTRGGTGDDFGLNEHTGLGSDMYRFRTPGLRNVELTGPWFRNGTAMTLRETVEFFWLGARMPAEDIPGTDAERLIDERLQMAPDELIDPRIYPMNDPANPDRYLSPQDIDDIVEFMKALTDQTIDSPYIDPTVPAKVPSGIPPVEIIAPFSLVPLPEHTSEARR